MADKAITDLNVVPGTIDDGNTWFAVAQSGAAYKVSGHEFILALTSILDGHGGIKTITYTAPVAPSLTGTLTITLADDTTTSLSIQNGKGITSIAKTGSSGLVDEYTITYNDSTTSSFNVTNGAKGDTGDSWYVWIRYAGSEPTQDSDMGTDPDNWIGIYSGTSSTAPTHYTDYDWFKIKGEQGVQGDPATIVSQSVTYQEGTSPNIQPSGTWTTTIPVVAQGNYLWTRTIVEFNSGSPVTFYSVARMGVDGAGSVSSVNGQSPDGNGNVTVTASDIQTTDSTSVQSDLTGLKNTLSQLDTDVGYLKSDIGIVEDTNTAQHTISQGQYVIWKGQLYTATAAIPAGTTLSSNNLKAIDSGGLNDLSVVYSTNIAITNHNTNMYFYRYGRLVFAATYGDWQSLPAGDMGTVGTVPQGFRPSSRVVLLEGTTGSTAPAIRLLFEPTGEIKGYNYGTAVTNRNGCYSGTWITGVDLPTT